MVFLNSRYSTSGTSFEGNTSNSPLEKSKVNSEREINLAINDLVSEKTVERNNLSSITSTCLEFLHDDVEVHDEEVSSGAIEAIYKILQYVLSLKNQEQKNRYRLGATDEYGGDFEYNDYSFDEYNNFKRNPNSNSSNVAYHDEEILILLRALTHVCQCSDEILEDNIEVILTDLLHIITRIMKQANEVMMKEKEYIDNDEEDESRDYFPSTSSNMRKKSNNSSKSRLWLTEQGIQHHLLMILNRFNFIESISKIVASREQIVSMLVQILQHSSGSGSSSSNVKNVPSTTTSIIKSCAAEVLADLVVNYCDQVNSMLQHENLLEVIVLEVIMEATFQSSTTSYRRETLRALQNLSYANANVVLSSSNYRNMISSLLMNLQDHEDVELRRLSIGTIWNLSKATPKKEELCDAVLLILVQTLFDEDDEVKYSTIYALRSFSTFHATANQLLSCTNFIHDLSTIIIMDYSESDDITNSNSNQQNTKIKLAAMKLLRDLSEFASIHELEYSCFDFFLNTIIQITNSCSDNLNINIILADILLKQVERRENLKYFINNVGIYDMISSFCFISSTVESTIDNQPLEKLQQQRSATGAGGGAIIESHNNERQQLQLQANNSIHAKVDTIVNTLSDYFASITKQQELSIIPIIDFPFSLLQPILKMSYCSSISSVDKFILRVLHYFMEQDNISIQEEDEYENTNTGQMAERKEVIEFLFECGKRTKDERWRVLALDILEILVLSWKEKYHGNSFE